MLYEEAMSFVLGIMAGIFALIVSLLIGAWCFAKLVHLSVSDGWLWFAIVAGIITSITFCISGFIFAFTFSRHVYRKRKGDLGLAARGFPMTVDEAVKGIQGTAEVGGETPEQANPVSFSSRPIVCDDAHDVSVRPDGK